MEKLAEELRTSIQKVRSLEVVVDETTRTVIIRGRTTSFYLKQMAQQAAMAQKVNNKRAWDSIVNEVVVE